MLLPAVRAVRTGRVATRASARGAQPSLRNLDDLLHFGLLTEREMQEYRAALDFMWRVRNGLHLRAGRANDQMSFELQEYIAESMGYGSMRDLKPSTHSSEEQSATLAQIRFEPDNPDLPVEQFMRDYYRHARAMKTYSDLVIAQCAARVHPPPCLPALVWVLPRWEARSENTSPGTRPQCLKARWWMSVHPARGQCDSAELHRER